MEFDVTRTVVAFVVLMGLATAGTLATPMGTDTVLMMVLPSLVVAGAIFLLLGVTHGEYRVRQP